MGHRVQVGEGRRKGMTGGPCVSAVAGGRGRSGPAGPGVVLGCGLWCNGDLTTKPREHDWTSGDGLS
jgi:hypothetical protein